VFVFRNLCKWIAGQLLGEYSPYFIYRWTAGSETHGGNQGNEFFVRQIDEMQLAVSDKFMQEQACYLGEESRAFGCFVDGQLAGVCFYWFGDRYKRRGFWPLGEDEAKLVHIVVSPTARGRGVAPKLIQASAQSMVHAGFSSLYARIWHSNGPSLHAFEKAGWLRTAFVLEFNPFGAKRRKRLQWSFVSR